MGKTQFPESQYLDEKGEKWAQFKGVFLNFLQLKAGLRWPAHWQKCGWN